MEFKEPERIKYLKPCLRETSTVFEYAFTDLDLNGCNVIDFGKFSNSDFYVEESKQAMANENQEDYQKYSFTAKKSKQQNSNFISLEYTSNPINPGIYLAESTKHANSSLQLLPLLQQKHARPSENIYFDKYFQSDRDNKRKVQKNKSHSINQVNAEPNAESLCEKKPLSGHTLENELEAKTVRKRASLINRFRKGIANLSPTEHEAELSSLCRQLQISKSDCNFVLEIMAKRDDKNKILNEFSRKVEALFNKTLQKNISELNRSNIQQIQTNTDTTTIIEEVVKKKLEFAEISEEYRYKIQRYPQGPQLIECNLINHKNTLGTIPSTLQLIWKIKKNANITSITIAEEEPLYAMLGFEDKEIEEAGVLIGSKPNSTGLN